MQAPDERYISTLRSGELVLPAAAQLTVPLTKEGGQVVVTYDRPQQAPS